MKKPRLQPRNILMTADCIGGVWTYAMELARALGAHGVSVNLATMGRPLSAEQRDEARALPNVSLHESAYRLEWMDEPWSDVRAAGEWLLELEARVRPDLIHLNNYAHGALPWRASTLVVAHSCVRSWWRAVHGCSAPASWNRYAQAVREGLRGADLVVAPSRAMRDALEEHYGPAREARVIYNGRSLPGVPPAAKEKVIFAAGRLWDEAKNISMLARLAPELPWEVCVAGDGTTPDGRSQSFPHVRCLGRLSAEALKPWYSRAAIYAFPARYEPFGLSILEAALAGCALVLGDIPSLREVWGEAALYAPPNQPGAWRTTLTRLAADRPRVADLGCRARDRARVFTPERMAAAYLGLYRELLELAEPALPREVAEAGPNLSPWLVKGAAAV